MQKQSINVLSRLLSKTFDSVLKIEQNALSGRRNGAITISEIHTIEAIGMLGEKIPRSMGDVAQELDIAVATLTVAINKLEKKGFVERTKTPFDRRVVLLCLTKKGRIVFREHSLYHQKMIEATLQELDEGEENVLIYSIGKLNDHFKKILNSEII